MRKKIAIRNLIAVSLLAVLSLVISIASFQMPLSYNIFNGLANSLPLGREFSPSIVAYYDAESISNNQDDFDSNLNKMVGAVNEFLKASFGDYDLIKTEKGFKITVPNVAGAVNALTRLNNSGLFEMKSENTAEAAAKLNSSHIKSVSYLQSNGMHGVYITFNDAGRTLFEELTGEVAGSGAIYTFVGGEKFSENSTEQAIPSGEVFLPGNYQTASEARAAVVTILSGTYDISLSLDNDLLLNSAVFGDYAVQFVGYASLAVLLVTLIFLIVKYKTLGYLAGLTLVLVSTIVLFAITLLPEFVLSSSSLVGISLAFSILMLNIMIVISAVRNEIRSGKKISIAVKFGFQNSLMQLVSLNAPVFGATLLLSWLGSGAYKLMAMPVAITSVISFVFVSFVLKWFVNSYLHINNKNHKKFGVSTVEVKSENV